MKPRIISVLEHQSVQVDATERGAQKQETFLTPDEFDALIRFNDTHQRRYFSAGYQCITFSQYVGYLQVGNLGIEILPKADQLDHAAARSFAWRDLLLEMIRVASGVKLISPSSAMLAQTQATLLELLVTRFVEELELLLRSGLSKGYRDLESNSPIFRGRLLVSHNVKENLTRPDRFYMRHATYDTNIEVNRCLSTTLYVVSKMPLSSKLRGRISACRLQIPELEEFKPRQEFFARLKLGRSTVRYAPALTLARLILEHRSPDFRAGPLPVFALLFDMNTLWEHYVAMLFRRAQLPGLDVCIQESRPFWQSEGSLTRTIRPDIIVRQTGSNNALAVVDTKWKTPRDDAPSVGDLRQMFVYNELFDAKHSLLVYPSVRGHREGRRGTFVGRLHQCRTVRLGLFAEGGLRTVDMVEQITETLRELQGAGDTAIGSS